MERNNLKWSKKDIYMHSTKEGLESLCLFLVTVDVMITFDNRLNDPCSVGVICTSMMSQPFPGTYYDAKVCF